jgi:hypothetical protein
MLLSIFNLVKRIIKRKKIQKYKRIYMKRAEKIIQVGGQGAK